MAETPRQRVQRITALLGPELWLEVRRSHVATLFGHELDGPNRDSAIKAIKMFAREIGCTWEITPDGFGVRFGRSDGVPSTPTGTSPRVRRNN